MLRPRTLAAIERARAAGLRVIVVTGRMFRSVLPYLEQAGIDDPVVCYQGAVVADPRHRHVPAPRADPAGARPRDDRRRSARRASTSTATSNDELYVAEVTPEAERYAGFQNLPLHAVGDLVAWLAEPPTKLVAIDEPDVLDGLEARMKERFAGRLYISKSLPFFLEFASPDVTKASGLAFLAEHLGLHGRAHGRLRGRRERRRAPRVGRLRRGGRQRASTRPRSGRLGLSVAEVEGVAQVIEAVLDSRAMIDIRAARAELDTYRTALARKGAAEEFDALMEADRAWLALVPQADELRAKTKLKGKPTPEQIEELKGVKAELQQVEEALAAAEAAPRRAARPRPLAARPERARRVHRDDAVELRRVGDPPAFAFEPRDHLELARIDTERGAKVSGSRFVYRVGAAALLELALYRFALDRMTAAGFTPVLPPVLVREEAMYGTGFLPTEEVNLYRVERDELYLTGTSEVALASMHGGEVLDADSLPLRYAGYSTCFRREAGAAGKDTRGMFRVHQFDKVEMFVFCRPEDSPEEHDRLLAMEEALVAELGLPYRVVNIAAGDLGAAPAKKYDIEGVVPRPGPLPRAHVDLEHDRLPVAPPRRPLPRRRRARVRPHAERHRRDGTDDDRPPRELPGRGRRGRRPRRPRRLRRPCPHRAGRLT